MYAICRALVVAGCEVRVLTTNANGLGRVLDVPLGEHELEPGLRVRYVRHGYRHSTSPALIRELPAHVRWGDVVHIGSAYNFPTIPTLAAARVFDRPVVLSPQGALQRWEGSTKPRVKLAYERVCSLIAPRRFALHLTSRSEQAQSRERMPSALAEYIPHSVTIPETSAAHVPRNGKLRLVALGRLHPIKGLENLLEACGKLATHQSFPFELTLAGDGDAAYVGLLQRRARELGIEASVVFAGQVNEAQKAALFARSDLLVAPSFTENFGLAIAEALAHGVPVIAGNGTPWNDLEEEGCGFWVPNDASTLALTIRRASTLPLREMGERGRQWMQRDFTLSGQGRAFVGLYERLLKG